MNLYLHFLSHAADFDKIYCTVLFIRVTIYTYHAMFLILRVAFLMGWIQTTEITNSFEKCWSSKTHVTLPHWTGESR